MLYAGFRELPAIEAVFFGLKAAVLAVVVEAVLRIGKRALKSRLMVLVAAVAFVAIFFFDVPFPLWCSAPARSGWWAAAFVPPRSPRR
jgi:chromate transporter